MLARVQLIEEEPVGDLTPRQVVERLDRHIIGQVRTCFACSVRSLKDQKGHACAALLSVRREALLSVRRDRRKSAVVLRF